MKEYDEATLKKVQQTEMEILRDFIKVCDENNLIGFSQQLLRWQRKGQKAEVCTNINANR